MSREQFQMYLEQFRSNAVFAERYGDKSALLASESALLAAWDAKEAEKEEQKEATYRRAYKHGWREAIDSKLPHASALPSPGPAQAVADDRADLTALIAEAQSLCDAATPGPWRSDEKVVGWLSGDAPACAVRYRSDGEAGWETWSPLAMCAPHLSGRYGAAGGLRPVEDAAFIARARTLIPELIAALNAAPLARPADGPKPDQESVEGVVNQDGKITRVDGDGDCWFDWSPGARVRVSPIEEKGGKQ